VLLWLWLWDGCGGVGAAWEVGRGSRRAGAMRWSGSCGWV
jgi:hypothetical protein